MGDSSPSAALTLLAEVYRERRTGVLVLGPEDVSLRVAVRGGHVDGILSHSAALPSPKPRSSSPDDSARLKLERVLSEVGLRARPPGAARVPSPPAAEPDAEALRERLLSALVDTRPIARFEDAADLPVQMSAVAGATEPLILEAVRRLPEADAVRVFLGDLDRRLVTTSTLSVEERTLTLTEGYILSRIDGQSTAREVLQLVPLDPDETERSLLGLILTGRVRTEQPVTRRVGRDRARPAAPAEPRSPPEEPSPEPHIPLEDPLSAEPSGDGDAGPETAGGGEAPPTGETDAELLARRREILEFFQSLPLRNHLEVLGLEPGCTDTDVRRAHVAHIKRYHPDMQRDARLADLHDVLEAIFIRVGEAWEVLGDAKSRAAYEARLGPRARPAEKPSSPAERRPPPASIPGEDEDAGARLSPEETLMLAQRLLRSARYWEAIRLLETAMPRLQPRRHEHRGRILLAKAYARNPNWIRKAEETLQNVVREDPANADAHYELGVLYKGVGQTARAQAAFKRAVELRPDHRGAAAEMGGGPPPAPGFLGRLFKRGKGRDED